MSARLSVREKAGYALSDTASNFFWKTLEFFLLVFYTDVFGITAAQAGTLFLVTRVWDALNDPLMGLIADRTRTRWGRFRPYLLWFAVPMAAAAVLTFSTPALSGTYKLAYAYVTYVLMMMIYTAINIPYSALMGVMTENSQERMSLSTFRFVGAFIGALIVQKFTLDLVVALGQGDAAKGWQLTMLLYGVAAALMFLATFAMCRERVQPPPAQRTKLTRDLRDLAKNGPWRVMVVLGFLVIISFWVRGASAAFYFKYCVEDEGLLSWFLASGGIAALIGVALTSTLTRFASKAGLYRLLMSLGGGLTIAYYWLDPHDLSLVFGLNILINLVLGPTAPLVWAMYADTADYSEWKTGRRATGLVFSAATLAQKLGGALGGAVTGWLLSYFDYVPNVPQTERTVSGIVLLVSVIPAGFGLAAAVTVTFYKLSDSLVLRIEDELRARREAGVMPA